MKIISSKIFWLVILITVVTAGSCKKNPDELTELHQKVGDYLVTVQYSPVEFTKGSGTLFIEFRSAAENTFVGVENLSTDAVLQSQGKPVQGETSVSPADKPGRYKVKYTFASKGDWQFNVKFGLGQHAQFLLTVK